MLFKKFTLSVLLSSSLLIASSDTDALFEMSLEELMNIEVQGSTKTSISKLNVPSSVTIFTQKEIQNMGASTLEDLKNFVPGFQSSRSANNSLTKATAVRGHQSGEDARDVLILIDGKRINTDSSGGIGVQTPMIALENIKKVEFIRGAGSALYGSNAFSAVISLTTINDENQVTLRAGKGSVKATALVSVEDGDVKFSGFVKAVKDNGETYHNPYNTIANNTTKTKDPYDAVDVYLQTFYKDFSFYIYHSSKSREDFYLLERLSNNNKRTSETSYINATYDFNYKNFDSQIAISFTEHAGKIDHLDLSPNLYGSLDSTEQTPSIEYFGDYKLNDKHSLQFGAEYRKPKIIDATVKYNNGDKLPLLDESSRDIIGVYAQYQGEVYDDLLLTLGIRYDDYSDFGSTLNPRSALVYSVSENTSIKMLYSSAYRAPSRNELDLQNNGILTGNKDLDAEEIDSYEVILSHQFVNQMINISFYRNEIKNVIEAKGTTFENTGSSNNKGVELEYSALFFNSLKTNLTYSHIIDQEDENFNISDDIASAIINYNYQKFNFNINGYYHSSVYNDYGTHKEKISSYVITNTKVTYAYTKDLNLYLQANNLFDKEYYAPTDSAAGLDVPNRGIEGFVGLEYSF